MPAFYSHYSFGLQGYRSIEDQDWKRQIREHHTVYTLGLLGPDLFFYYLPDVLLGSKKPAMVMHDYKTNRFFEMLLMVSEQYSGRKREIAQAYIAGFIGHYAMDTACHPYIYEMASRHEKPSEWHYRYESAMDIYCCRHFLHRYPSQMNVHQMLQLSREEMNVVGWLTSEAYNRAYRLPHLFSGTIKGAVFCMHITLSLLRDRRGGKEYIARAIEKRLLGFGLISPLFVNFNMYAVDQREITHFEEMFNEGLERFAEYLQYYSQYCEALQAERQTHIICKRRRLLSMLGNLSYHTGAPCEEDYLLRF